jgi:hypothetical protein
MEVLHMLMNAIVTDMRFAMTYCYYLSVIHVSRKLLSLYDCK